MATGGQINTNKLSDETFDVLCTICKNKGKNTEGVKFCVDCKDYFCIECVQVHSQVPLCAGHRVLDKSQVTSRISKGQPRAPEERCDRHSHKHIDMYCQNHDRVGCSTCMAVDHRSCPDTVYIPEFIQNNTYQSALTEIQTKLKEISKTLAEQIANFKQDNQRLLKRKAELLDDIRKYRQQINDQLDKLERDFVDQLENMVKQLEDKIEDNLKKLQANMAKVTSANDKLASPNTNQAEVFVHVKIGEDAADVADKFIEDNKSKSTGDDIKFQPDITILTQLKRYAFGTLTKEATKTPDTLFQIKGKESYCITAMFDKEVSNFISTCCLKDGTRILADREYKKLKRFYNNNYTVTDYCLPAAPWQVCSINTTQVAVTLPSQKEVHFISVEGQMTTTNKINTDFECVGLAYTNDNLYVSDHTTNVYIYNLSGMKLSQLRIILRRSLLSPVRNQLCNITSLAVSKDATRIYVADRDCGLIVLDNKGTVITKFNGKKLQRANCCHVTEVGSVLVSGYSSNNVLQFTCDGELLGEVIKADSEKGEIVSVCCNQQMSKMYV
ncbi:E3 ubiquitin-protein ligase Midline-1-like [Ruditapes philippinarum]|uniref:E3 ubiquitin-protein ligase Midline-1-like n=1 Tax=Ruditapes philippinarum TaxID=129788 RepID=UPI00295AE282|nr:E3 ubiquitin-protein ligase Midline-1-like [Ruditapes philippinarum]